VRRNAILLCLLLTCSCSQTTTIPVVQPDSPVAVPDAEAMNLASVQWHVMGLPELKQYVAKLEQSQQKQVLLFSLDTTNYNNLSQNLVEIERYINEQKAILAMVKKILHDRSVAADARGSSTP
jgi:hypothetical protein